MTTIDNINNSGKTIKDHATKNTSTPFDLGAGHTNPNRAADPGLIYDLQTNDDNSFLCTIGYISQQIAVFIENQTPVNFCSDSTKALGNPGALKYPSFVIIFSSNSVVTYNRVVINVGYGPAGYNVEISSPRRGLNLIVKGRD